MKVAGKSGSSYFEQSKGYIVKKKDATYSPKVQTILQNKVIKRATVSQKETKYDLYFARPEVKYDGIQEFDKKLFKRIKSYRSHVVL